MDLSSDQYKKWQLKRKHTFIAFCIGITIIGMEYSLTFLTLWLYIKEMLNTKTPKLYYSAVSVSFMLSSSLMTPFIGRIVDKRRNVIACFLVCNMLMITGNILYSLPFSPILLIAGRSIAGFGGALKSVIFSETIRSYPASETNSKLSVLSIMSNLGFMAGQGVNFFFKDMNFFIGRWHLRDVNFPGLFMGLICILMQVVTILMVHNISKEFDYKAATEKTDVTDVDAESLVLTIKDDESIPILQYTNEKKIVFHPIKSNNPTVTKILKMLFFHFDSALLMFATFFLAFFLINQDIWLPLLVVEKMHLSILEMNISVFGASGVCGIILLLSMWRSFSDKNMVLFLLISLFGFCIVSAAFIILSVYPFNKALNVILCILYMLSLGGAPILVDVFFVNTLAKMVNSNVQTFVDSIRQSIFSVGAFIAFSCSAFLFDYVEVFGTLYIVILVIIGILFIVRRSHFIDPKLLV